ncbi:MAG: hypothetical protein V4793_46885 [Paraburkholderia tropica]
MVVVKGDDARLVPGMAFTLDGHPREEWNRNWRPVRIVHHGKQHVSQQEESAEAEQGTQYCYEAELVPDDVEWKAPLLPKPRIDGPQIATITGPAGEEIHCDEYGRVIVQFPWDREGKNDDHSSCWIRVATTRNALHRRRAFYAHLVLYPGYMHVRDVRFNWACKKRPDYDTRRLHCIRVSHIRFSMCDIHLRKVPLPLPSP